MAADDRRNEPWTLTRVHELGGQWGITPREVENWTIREITAFARGADRSHRFQMATKLWAVREGAVFGSYVNAGKRVPKIEDRLQAIMHGPKQRSGVADTIFHMKEIAKRRNLPPPKRRKP